VCCGCVNEINGSCYYSILTEIHFTALFQERNSKAIACSVNAMVAVVVRTRQVERVVRPCHLPEG
jgi:hypothetical protein